MAQTDKFIRVEPDTHKLVDTLTARINSKKVYPSRIYNAGTVKIALEEFVRNHPELGVK